LHGGFDFSDAHTFSAQGQDQVLAGIVLAADGYDTHVSHDSIKHATFKAEDLRFRCEIDGKDAMKLQATISILIMLHAVVEKIIRLDQLTAVAALVEIQFSSGTTTWTKPVIVSQDLLLK
jgi:hypothetical protein